MDLMIEDLMEQLVEDGGSDLHIASGQPPYGRFSGELRPMREDALAEEDCNKLIFSMLNNSQRKTLEQTWELDCAYGLKGVARFRVNVYRQKGSYAACLRALGSTIPSVELLNLPPVVLETSARPRGLVLVTGPTGSGKTTTLAALLDHINHTRSEHILTIEDPIEFVYQSDKSLVHQRQLNEDTRSFANALRAALREDPDVILVGEMRDPETIELGRRIEISIDDNPDPNALTPVGLALTLNDGRTVRTDVEVVYGNPARPMSREAQLAKLDANWNAAARTLPEQQREALVAAVDGLESITDVTQLVDCVVAP